MGQADVNKRVLVSYGFLRSSWAIVRNLARNGLEVHVGHHQKYYMTKYSRYVSGAMEYPDFKTNPEQFVEAIVGYCERHNIGTYIPSHEEGFIVSRFLGRFPKTIRVGVGRYDSIKQLSDKKETASLCRQVGIRHPKTICFTSYEDLELKKDLIPYPGILKSRVSHGSHGIYIYRDSSQFWKGWLKLTSNQSIEGESLPVAQEYLEGKRIYTTNVLTSEGGIEAVFQRRNLREKELFGGAAVKCESTLEPRLRDTTEELVAHVRLSGVAMFEYLVDEVTHEYWLMEVNPRYWGTTAHDIDCGIEFPWLQYCLLQNIPVKIRPDYPLGVKSKWIVGDILALAKRLMHDRPHTWPAEITEHFDFDTHSYIDFKLDDPVPFFVQVLIYLKNSRAILGAHV